MIYCDLNPGTRIHVYISCGSCSFFGVRRCWGGVGGIRLLMACNTSLSADEVHYESYNCVNCSNCGNPFLYSCTLIGKVMSPPYRYFHSSPSVVFLKARNRSTCLSAL